LAPELCSFVKPAAVKGQSVAEARVGTAWARDLRGYLTVMAILQYLRIWRLIANELPLRQGEDVWTWKWTASGDHSCKSAYKITFEGRENCGWADLVWKPWAPLKFKLFV
jgi:hypothetical protein